MGFINRRRSAALVIALAFVAAFLGLAAVVVSIVANERTQAAALVNATQTDLSATAGSEEALFFLNGINHALAPTAQDAAAMTRGENTAHGPRTLTVGHGCTEWWVEAFNATSGAGRIAVRTWTPGDIGVEGCARRESSAQSTGSLVTMEVSRAAAGGPSPWAVTHRVVEQL